MARTTLMAAYSRVVLLVGALACSACALPVTEPPPTEGGGGPPPIEPGPPPIEPGSPTDAAAELPRQFIDTKLPTSSGTTKTVAAGDNLQAAIDAAQPGDVLMLEAGATWTGNFVLPKKSGTAWIVIRTATPDAQLPPEGTRITPASASLLPKLRTAAAAPVIATAGGAHNYRLIGLEITAAPSVTYMSALVALGAAPQPASDVPTDLVLDRVYIHGHGSLDLGRCVALNSAMSAVIDSYLSDCHAKGRDSQAILGWNGPGPFKIVNNYLEGAGENVMFGGSDASITNLVPSDIEIRGNYFFKPTAWKGVWTVKNLFELKNARRVLAEGNVFENNWVDGQAGYGILFKSVNQDGSAPWSRTTDVTFRYNRVRNSAAGINLHSHPESNPVGEEARRLTIRQNVFEGLSDRASMIGGALEDVTFAHNTFVHTAESHGLYMSGVHARFTYRDNLASYGNIASAEGKGQGGAALSYHAPGSTVSGNVLVLAFGMDSGVYPSGNFFPKTAGAVGFTNLGGGDYSLSASSPYVNKATDGTNPGADIAKLTTILANVTRK